MLKRQQLFLLVLGLAGAQALLNDVDNRLQDGSDQRNFGALTERALSQLSLAVSKKSGSLEKSENSVIAPASVAAALGLLLAGASGHTKEQIRKLAGIRAQAEEDGVQYYTGALVQALNSLRSDETITLSNGVFVQEGASLKEGFRKLLKTWYGGELQPVQIKKDLQGAIRKINKWAYEKTKGKIPQMLEDLDPMTTLVIANTLYFSGKWLEPFPGGRYNYLKKFAVSEKESVDVTLMLVPEDSTYSRKKGQYEAVGLPYQSGETMMYFVLPEEGQDLRSFVSGLKPEDLHEIVNNTIKSPALPFIPKMRLETSLDLKQQLPKYGVTPPYEMENIGHDLVLGSMVHKVTIDVTESGTEAAAATYESFSEKSLVPIVIFNRPFLFFIYNRPTSSILFFGTVFRPQPIPGQPIPAKRA